MDRYPHIRALAHIPLSLSIICSVAKSHILPETTTELYQHYIGQVCCLNQDKYKKSSDYARAIYASLCEIALAGILTSKYVFTAEELKSVGIKLHDAFDGLGLLKVIPSFRNPAKCLHNEYLTEEYTVLYQFQHTTVQEFLAAQRIQELGPEEQARLLGTYRNERRFYNTWKFLAGITHLQDRNLRDSLIFSTNEKNSKELLFLLHCLYEAHDPVISQETACWLHYKLNFSNTSINPIDCLCAMYTVISAGGYWELIFRGSNIGAEGLEILKEHLKQAYERSRTDHYSLFITKLE